MNERQPTEDELRAAMEEQMRRITVQDVLFQTTATLVNLAARRMSLAPGTEGERDLEQARLAIEGVRALIPLLPAEEAPPVREALSQLQMAYAREAQGSPKAAAGGEPAGPKPEGEGAKPQAAPAPEGQEGLSEAERAKARSKIWTPPGAGGGA